MFSCHAALAQRFHLRRPKTVVSPIMPVYVGTDTLQGGRGIYRAAFNTQTGQFQGPAVLAAAAVRPSFLALGPATTRRMLYAVNEALDNTASVSSFVVTTPAGDLQQVGKVSSGSPGPCAISVDATGHAAFVANYAGGSVSSYRVRPDGTLEGPVQQVNLHEAAFGADGPNKARQDGPHPHSVTLSPDDRFVMVNDLGHDDTLIFQIDPETAAMRFAESQPFRNGRAGSGPRHLVFHPNGRWVYGINELDSTIDHFLWTETHGARAEALLVNAGPPVKTVAEGPDAEKNTAAEIAISPNGRFLYASNRGENSLVVFRIDDASGALSLVQRIPCGGKWPRQFTLDPSGKWLLCGNEQSGTVTVFARDAASGRLNGPVASLPVPAPQFVLCLA